MARPCPTCEQPIPTPTGTYCSAQCRPSCSFEGCARPTYGTLSICRGHYWQYKCGSGVLKPLRIFEAEYTCIVCEVPVPEDAPLRRYCSYRCAGRAVQNPNRPKDFSCIKCGTVVSLIVPSTKTGQFKRSDSKLCNKCKQKNRTGMTVGEIAKRDGTSCGICELPVDLSASKADPDRPSIDHIMPRAAGGTNDPTNLQLAHLSCNQLKHAKVGFSLAGVIHHGR